MKVSRQLLCCMLLGALSSPIEAQDPSVNVGSKYGMALAAQKNTINNACNPVLLPPGSSVDLERESISAEMARDIGPIPTLPGAKPVSLESTFERLDVAKGIFDRWSDLSCVDSRGRPRLALLGYSVEKGFGFGSMKEVRPVAQDVALRQIELIRQRFSDTAFAILVEAAYWHSAGWDARGDGYMSSVTPQGMRIFQEDIDKEKALLLSNKAIGLTNPEYYVELLKAEGSVDGYSPELVATFKEGASRFKFYETIPVEAITFSDERWGGSWDAIDELIRWSADDTRSQIGEWMYARLYGYVGQYMVKDEILFSATPASWPLMRTGYISHFKKVPTDYLRLNLFTRYSCEAADRETFLAYRSKLEARIDPEAWKGPLSLAVCDAKFKYHTRKS